MRISANVSQNLVRVLVALMEDQNPAMLMTWSAVLQRIAKEISKEARDESNRVIGCAPAYRVRVRASNAEVDVTPDSTSGPSPADADAYIRHAGRTQGKPGIPLEVSQNNGPTPLEGGRQPVPESMSNARTEAQPATAGSQESALPPSTSCEAPQPSCGDDGQKRGSVNAEGRGA